MPGLARNYLLHAILFCLLGLQVLPPYLDPERGVLPDRITGPSPRHAALVRMAPQPSLGISMFPKIETTLPTSTRPELAGGATLSTDSHPGLGGRGGDCHQS